MSIWNVLWSSSLDIAVFNPYYNLMHYMVFYYPYLSAEKAIAPGDTDMPEVPQHQKKNVYRD